ncbi:MAG: flagellar biosynthesis anti-sigma factor FlgM [Thermoleophilaceae bacterium]|jgi:hypothetical protein|nr:flagellar biosynthesis anti-sigma factor FlgM [Thermoleophilaceae bacterium]
MSQAATLRQQIADGTYRVEPDAVAAAIIARHGARVDLQRLFSEMLVAPQPARGGSREDEPLAGHDAA